MKVRINGCSCFVSFVSTCVVSQVFLVNWSDWCQLGFTLTAYRSGISSLATLIGELQLFALSFTPCLMSLLLICTQRYTTDSRRSSITSTRLGGTHEQRRVWWEREKAGRSPSFANPMLFSSYKKAITTAAGTLLYVTEPYQRTTHLSANVSPWQFKS